MIKPKFKKSNFAIHKIGYTYSIELRTPTKETAQLIVNEIVGNQTLLEKINKYIESVDAIDPDECAVHDDNVIDDLRRMLKEWTA